MIHSELKGSPRGFWHHNVRIRCDTCGREDKCSTDHNGMALEDVYPPQGWALHTRDKNARDLCPYCADKIVAAVLRAAEVGGDALPAAVKAWIEAGRPGPRVDEDDE